MAPSTASTRIDPTRTAEYPVVLGSSITSPDKPANTSFTSVKYNFKPQSAIANTVPPTIKPTSPPSNKFNLTLHPPAQKPIEYQGTGIVPGPRAQHVLIFNPETKTFTLEKLSAAFVFNSDIYKAHPFVPPEEPDVDENYEDEGESVFDYRKFMDKPLEKGTAKGKGKGKAVETAMGLGIEKPVDRRREALKKAGRSPLPPKKDKDDDIVIPDAPKLAEPQTEAATEPNNEHVEKPAAPPPSAAPTPPPKKAKLRKPRAAPDVLRVRDRPKKPPVKKAAAPKATETAEPVEPDNELVLPDVPSTSQPDDPDEELLEFSDLEDEPRKTESAREEELPADDMDDELDLEAALEKALEGQDEDAHGEIDDNELVMEYEEPVNVQKQQQHTGPIMSLAAYAGGEEDSESEEE